jgi:hypothetical protein
VIFWFLVFLWSDCLFNSARVRRFFSGKSSGKSNGNSGSDCLVSFAHVVALTRFFSGKWIGKSVCFTSSGCTGSLFCSSH